ncbi:tyrosine aminotransferase [Cimex lectularius]|uniref:Tyrosine aminotransferase n=1 Tax=Cimex lectularius TaxID=79782 RepID=A0A8I6RNV9_CIMLE|nr:tyrosine aminotransferase [Cimex lectularius]
MVRRCWDEVESSNFARNTHNPIRHIVENLNLEPNPDKPMIALSIGDPTIFGNLKPPIEVIEAVKESLDTFKYNGYAASTGYQEARQAVAEYSSNEKYTVKAEDVILCSGCSCALDLCITAVANPGQNILVPRPGFSIYRTLAEGLGINVKEYNLIPEKGWEADLYHMESQIDSNTVAIIINNPSNPCGSVFSKKHLWDIVQVASRNYLPIIADEIYEHLVFKGEKFIPIASLSDDVPILSCSGLTKRFLIPGWRMGWIIIHDRNNVLGREIRGGLQKLSQRIIGSSTVIQGAIPKILKETPQSFFQDTIAIIQRNAQLAYFMLAEIEGLKPVMPQGAMYIMVGIDMAKFPKFKTGLDFVRQMVNEESVFCLPGECFGYSGYMRIVLTVPEKQLIEACMRIGDFCSRHFKTVAKTPIISYQQLSYVKSLEESPISPLTDLEQTNGKSNEL